MNKIQQSDQRGSATTFVIVGIILTIGLIGTVYVLRQHGEQVRKEQAIAAYDKQQTGQKKAEKISKTNVVNSGDSKIPGSSDSPDASKELPVTGPRSNVDELIGAGLLTGALVGYLSSRRNSIRSL